MTTLAPLLNINFRLTTSFIHLLFHLFAEHTAGKTLKTKKKVMAF